MPPIYEAPQKKNGEAAEAQKEELEGTRAAKGTLKEAPQEARSKTTGGLASGAVEAESARLAQPTTTSLQRDPAPGSSTSRRRGSAKTTTKKPPQPDVLRVRDA